MKEKLIINFDGNAGKTSIPVYPFVDITTEDYIKFEFGSANTNSFFDVRVTFNSIVKNEYIQVRTAALPNSIYEFYIKERLEDESSQKAIKSEIALIECAPVNAKFRIIVYNRN
jgi:hypothetical protein